MQNFMKLCTSLDISMKMIPIFRWPCMLFMSDWEVMKGQLYNNLRVIFLKYLHSSCFAVYWWKRKTALTSAILPRYTTSLLTKVTYFTNLIMISWIPWNCLHHKMISNNFFFSGNDEKLYGEDGKEFKVCIDCTVLLTVLVRTPVPKRNNNGPL